MTESSAQATRRALLRQALGGAVALAAGAASSAELGRSLVVVYPELGEPFRQVFTSIIEGIEDKLGGAVTSVVMPNNANPAQVADDIRKREAKVLIGLGRGGMRVAAALADELAVLVGCVVSVQESEARSFPVHTLAPDPALLLARLKRLRPGAKRVHLVYDPKLNAWLAKLAREAARAEGLELATQEVVDQAEALRAYTQLLAAADPARDTLWLPQDPTTVDDNAVLPLVLREGWNRNITVFSSHLAHVKRGALFSLYPDNRELGRTLAAAAQRLVAAPKSAVAGVLPLRQARSAINIRTAAHLGIDVATVQSGFDLVYPSS
ncbi:putative ABC transport system substrate-binding protein [Pelomonas saccharophila]|uniref:ABC transport system substrate-binding protein n=1 Tax=Roseateles saccharophilus TaxID=304 RepID=A0ABU1YWJ7_ROSSA|nr:putative ABC transport system substrate-binding protein [Roseateles saccharophilus]